MQTPQAEDPEFLSLAEHDLTAKLRTIGHLANFVREDLGDTVSADTARHLDMIADSSDEIGTLVSGLIEFEQAARKGARQPKRLQMAELLTDVWASLDGTEGIDLLIDLPRINCATDISALTRCLGHLVKNAVEHRRRSRGLVRVSAEALQDYIEIVIDDDGVGFPMEHVEMACQPLRKLSYKGRSTHGCGLGLAVVARLVDSHRGELQIRSSEGTGTSIRVRWPIAPCGEVTADSGDIIWID